MRSDPLRRGRRLLWVGVVVFVLGMIWDGAWHSRNPEALEAGWNLLEAHGIMYAGMLVALVGGLWAFVGSQEVQVPVASWYGLAAAGALAQLVGSGWDAWAHAQGSEVAMAHLLSRLGLVAVLVATIAATVQAHRSEGSPA